MGHEGISIESVLCRSPLPPPVSGTALAFLLQERRGNVKCVSFKHCILNEEHIRALSNESRPYMKVTLDSCELEDSVDCRNAFIECLQNNRGPTKLSRCDIDHRVLANTLRGNTRLTSIHLLRGQFGQDVDHTGQAELFRALAGNMGLVEVKMLGCSISNENLAVLCESLQGHTTLTSLDLVITCPLDPTGTRGYMSMEQKRDRTHMVADMMRANTILQTINFREDEREEQIYTEGSDSSSSGHESLQTKGTCHHGNSR
jgi:hypothetical protein